MKIKKYTTKLDANKHNSLDEVSCTEVTDRDMKYPAEIAAALNEAYDLEHMAEEYLYMVGFSIAGNVLGVFEVSHGVVSQSIASPREIFIRALLSGAAYIVLVHNHPSGSTDPSEGDFALVRRIYDSGRLMCVPLIDNIIIGEDGAYFSFREEHMMPNQKTH